MNTKTPALLFICNIQNGKLQGDPGTAGVLAERNRRLFSVGLTVCVWVQKHPSPKLRFY